MPRTTTVRPLFIWRHTMDIATCVPSSWTKGRTSMPRQRRLDPSSFGGIQWTSRRVCLPRGQRGGRPCQGQRRLDPSSFGGRQWTSRRVCLPRGQRGGCQCQEQRRLDPSSFGGRNGHRDVCAFLVDKRADVNAKNNDGKTPLQLLRRKNEKDVVELLSRVKVSAPVPKPSPMPLPTAPPPPKTSVIVSTCNVKVFMFSTCLSV